MARTEITLFAYGPDALEERRVERVEEIRPCLHQHPVLWVNVEGLEDEATVRAIAELFHVHPLALEDVLTHHERAKVDTYPDHDFIVMRMLDANGKLQSEQLSVFLASDVVITFQDRLGGDPFGPVRDRLRKGLGPLRAHGPDYLAYSLLDSVVDAYFPVIERYGDDLEDLEYEAVEHPSQRTLSRIHRIKRDLLRIRRAVWPLRDALVVLGRAETPYVHKETRLYLRDLRDQSVQVAELIDTLRDLGSSLTDLYMSSVSNRLNEVMKVLTIISTIFIPLSFVTGFYGMNFDPQKAPWIMPMLRWKFGFPVVVAGMFAVAGGMLLYFRRKGWIGPNSRAPDDEAPEEEPRGAQR